MKNLAIVCLALLILPFILGYIQCGVRKTIVSAVCYYRYFSFMNVILAAVFVSGRMFFAGESEAMTITGWSFSPIYHLYGIAILSAALLGLFTLFKNERVMLSVSIYWCFFAVLSSLSHAYQIYLHQVKQVDILVVHIVYNLVVVGILLYFIRKIYRGTRQRSVIINTADHE